MMHQHLHGVVLQTSILIVLAALELMGSRARTVRKHCCHLLPMTQINALSVCAPVQGKSSKTFKDELGFVGSEEIIHRNNICLLSIVQSLETNINLDGTPDSTPDEQSPSKLQYSTAYDSMTNQAGIPGLTNQAWPPQQQPQQHPGHYQVNFPAASASMEAQSGSGQGGFGASNDSYWHQQHPQQQQHQYGGNAPSQHQGPGHLGVATRGVGPPGLLPSMGHQPGQQPPWQGNSAGHAPTAVIKQEPGVQHPFGSSFNNTSPFDPAASASMTNPHHHLSPTAASSSGGYPPHQPQPGQYGTFPLSVPSTGFPPSSNFPPKGASPSVGMSQYHQQGLTQQGPGGPPNQPHAGHQPQDPCQFSSFSILLLLYRSACADMLLCFFFAASLTLCWTIGFHTKPAQFHKM